MSHENAAPARGNGQGANNGSSQQQSPNSTPPITATGAGQVFEQHPLGKLFPSMSGLEFAGLVEDVRQNGLREPITLYEGKVLDGWHRYKACRIAEKPLMTQTYEGNDPLAYAVSHNLNRRHMNESQRAMVAARVAKLARGRPKTGSPAALPPTQAAAAALVGVSERLLRDARVVDDSGNEVLIREVERGAKTVTAAVKEVRPKAKPRPEPRPIPQPRPRPEPQAQPMPKPQARPQLAPTTTNNNPRATLGAFNTKWPEISANIRALEQAVAEGNVGILRATMRNLTRAFIAQEKGFKKADRARAKERTRR